MTLLTTYRPERETDYGLNTISELFDRIFNDEARASNQYFAIPPANIRETEKDFRIELSVPGYQKSDFNIELDEHLLVISLERDEKSKDNGEYVLKEFNYNQFRRSFRLSDRVKKEDISAKYENGVLTVFVPKKEQLTNRSVEIS
ncbi:MAG: Hsp20/alpha crystallin family protein [Bacteroidales bacterium]|nr:Hsp20/alpha crystallin family protein [Bacteroidales bacterium]